MTTAREMIEEEIALDDRPYAAERVIERLWKDCATLSANYEAAERRAKAAEQRVEELETKCAACSEMGTDCDKCKVGYRDEARERYRARLDAMVGAVLNSRDQTYSSEDSSGLTVRQATVKRAGEYLAAIDAEVAEKMP